MASNPDGIATLFGALTGYQRTGALKAAVDLDLFTAVAEGNATAAALATRCRAAERGVRSLCDFLAASGLLAKEGDRYALPPDIGPFLDRRSPMYLGSVADFMASPLLFHAFADVAAAVRKGGTALEGEGSTAPEHPMWVQFARGMAPLAAMTAEMLAGVLASDGATPGKILDVAAGHGLFGITLAKHHPEARVVALDWPNVLAVAAENARAAGVADRFRTLPGSAFDVDWGGGYDLVLLTNFLHHFDVPTCEQIFRKSHAALASGGRVVALEFVPNADRVTPPEAATFGLVMLVTTPAGDAYSYAEYERMLRATGFARSALKDLPIPNQRVVVGWK
jgi:ubiquinone/menaquinone biosynthesis C-methylase UbiE